MAKTTPPARTYCLRLGPADARRLDAVQAHYQGRIDALGQVQTVSTADVLRTLLKAESERLGLETEAPMCVSRARRAKRPAAA